MKKVIFLTVFLSLFTITNFTKSVSASHQFMKSSQTTGPPTTPEPNKEKKKDPAPSATIPATPPREEPS